MSIYFIYFFFSDSNKSPSPPITTNHNNADAWPSLQRDSNSSSSSSNSDEKSQSPTIDSTTATPPPPVINHTGPPPGVTRPPHINHHIEEALVAGIPLPLTAELQAVIAGISPATSNSQSPSLPSELSGPGTPSPDSTTGKCGSENYLFSKIVNYEIYSRMSSYRLQI